MCRPRFAFQYSDTEKVTALRARCMSTREESWVTFLTTPRNTTVDAANSCPISPWIHEHADAPVEASHNTRNQRILHTQHIAGRIKGALKSRRTNEPIFSNDTRSGSRRRFTSADCESPEH